MTTSLPVQGTLSTAAKTMYAVPRGKTAEVTWLSVCNEGPTTAVVRITLHRAGQGAVLIGVATLAELHTARVIEKTERLPLRAGDRITATASTNHLTFLISGTES